MWNQGLLPSQLTIDNLLAKHKSYPRNQLIANVFYLAGFIETWGRGISKIRSGFEREKMAIPTFKEEQGGFCLSFKRKYPGMTAQVTDQVTDQVKALLSIFENSCLSVKEMMSKMHLTHRRSFVVTYLMPAIAQGVVEPLYPDRPNHPRQKYRLKAKQ